MFLKLTAGGELQFEDRQNFRAFKLVVEGDRARLDAVRRAVAGKAELSDAETAWDLELPLSRRYCPVSKRPKLFSLIANAATLLLLLAGCSGGVLEPQGPIGAANIQILLNALAIMLMIVVPTIIGVLVFCLVVSRLQHAGALPARLRLFRPHRAHRLGDLSFTVWLHHFFTMGAGGDVNAVFGIATSIIAVGTGVKVYNWMFTMYGGRIRYATPMLWSVGFIITFIIGGMTGVLLAVPPADFQLHNSLFLVAHFHNVIIGGVLFAGFAGITYWFPKAFGFRLHEGWGKSRSGAL